MPIDPYSSNPAISKLGYGLLIALSFLIVVFIIFRKKINPKNRLCAAFILTLAAGLTIGALADSYYLHKMEVLTQRNYRQYSNCITC